MKTKTHTVEDVRNYVARKMNAGYSLTKAVKMARKKFDEQLVNRFIVSQ